MTICANCGGLIPEPNRTYGYAGKFCYCSCNANVPTIPERCESQERELALQYDMAIDFCKQEVIAMRREISERLKQHEILHPNDTQGLHVLRAELNVTQEIISRIYKRSQATAPHYRHRPSEQTQRPKRRSQKVNVRHLTNEQSKTNTRPTPSRS